jgi:hypothetical protein
VIQWRRSCWDPEHGPGRDQRRNEDSGHTDTEPGEVESVLPRRGIRRRGPDGGGTWS